MEKEWKSGEAIWHMKQAECNALDVAAMNKLNEIIDVATLRQRVAELEKQRDELLAAAEAIEIDAEECLDFDECTAMLVPIDTYHKLIEAIASINEK